MRPVLGPPLLSGGYGQIEMRPGAVANRRRHTDGARRRGSRAHDRLVLCLGLRGLLTVLFGVVALAWPSVTVLTLALLFAAYAVMDGAGMITSGLDRQASGSQRWLYLAGGLAGLAAGVAAGVIAALWPQITALALVVLAGAWAIVTGLLEVTATVIGLLELPAAARPGRARTAEWMMGVSGVISVAAGIVVLMQSDAGAPVLASALGLFGLTVGVVLLSAAWLLRNASSTASAHPSRASRTGAST